MSSSSVCHIHRASCRCEADNPDQLKPVSSAYARYSPDATFHDPIGLAKGLESVVCLLFICMRSTPTRID